MNGFNSEKEGNKMTKLRWIAGIIFISALCGLLHLHAYNPDWWILTVSFYFILRFTVD